jgi:hypothetical protein
MKRTGLSSVISHQGLLERGPVRRMTRLQNGPWHTSLLWTETSYLGAQKLFTQSGAASDRRQRRCFIGCRHLVCYPLLSRGMRSLRRYQYISMNPCNHNHLILLPKQSNKLRCHHCHLTIKINELSNRYCPECFEVSGKKRYEFEEVKDAETGTVQYRCEDCGVIIDCV